MSTTAVRPTVPAPPDAAPRSPLHAERFGPAPASIAADPVVLLHGQPGLGGVWRGVGEALAGHDLHAVAVDRPGYGRTGGEATGFAGNAAALVEFFDHHDIDQATLVTHSWASGIALALAASHPDRVRAMVLLAPVGAPASVTALDHLLAVPVLGWGALRAGLRLGAWALDRDATRRFLPKGFGDLEPVMAKRMAGSAMSAGARRSAAVEQRALVRELPSVRRRLDSVDVPTVVMSGSHDLIVAPTAAADLADRIAGARLERVEAGHLLPAEVPDRVAAVVADLVLTQP